MAKEPNVKKNCGNFQPAE